MKVELEINYRKYDITRVIYEGNDEYQFTKVFLYNDEEEQCCIVLKNYLTLSEIIRELHRTDLDSYFKNEEDEY